MPKIGASIIRPKTPLIPPKATPKPLKSAEIGQTSIPVGTARITKVAPSKDKKSTIISLEISPLRLIDEVDPAIALAEAADKEGMLAKDLIRFPALLAKHGISDAGGLHGAARRADELNRKLIDELLTRHKRKERVYAENPKQDPALGATETIAPPVSVGNNSPSTGDAAEEPRQPPVHKAAARISQRPVAKQRKGTSRQTNQNRKGKVSGKGGHNRKSSHGGGQKRKRMGRK